MTTYLIDREFHEGDRLNRMRSAHRSYWRGIARTGALLGGGGWTEEGCRETLLLRTEDRGTVQYLLGADPYTQERLIRQTRIMELDGLGPDWPPAHTLDSTGPEPTRLAPVAHESTAPVLNAHEQRVAQLMLGGLTNRQIAETFLVTPRAVEQHITRIYRKLSISRRAQLANALRSPASAIGAPAGRVGA